MSALAMFDLAGDEDDRRISPFCWRIRLALAHKGLEVRTIPWRLSEKETIRQYGASAVPVLLDGNTAIHDSWRIALYLDEAYPDSPLFESDQAKAYALWIHNWTERCLHPLIVPIILADVTAHLHPKDSDFFRKTREHAFGTPLESIMDQSVDAFDRLRSALSPLRRTLISQPFVAGASPAYADYAIFGAFQWARCCSPQILIRRRDDPMLQWIERMLELYDGMARCATGYDTYSQAAVGKAEEGSIA